ncbi:MAG: hypothetical protein QW590_01845 [Candidatus Bilamarchaeaceae archaeon]
MILPHKGLTIALDHGYGDVPFISHAHSDHTNGIKKEKKVIASEETLALINASSLRINVDGTKLVNAGHILGARQLVLEEDGCKTVYTGDFSVKPNIFGMSAEIVECDRLIMESTYASPEYRFREPFEIYNTIAEWVRKNESKNIIIGAYELGKAQEIIRVLNEYCGIAPVVTERTAFFSSVYNSFGHNLDRVAIGTTEAEEALRHPFIGIVPMRLAKRRFAEKLTNAFERKTLVAVATGWALRCNYNVDAAFPLSNHADFYDLVAYAEQSGAKRVEFFDGDGEKVVNALSKRHRISALCARIKSPSG